eukprot:5182004-Amphidinium_carterae.1
MLEGELTMTTAYYSPPSGSTPILTPSFSTMPPLVRCLRLHDLHVTGSCVANKTVVHSRSMNIDASVT